MRWRRSGFALGAVLLAVAALPRLASAHGEVAQDPFIREETAVFHDVRFSAPTIRQGEPLTITGTVHLLQTWPRQLAQPESAYLSVTTPGPVVVIVDREIGGQKAPMSVYVTKGQMYDFSLTVRGRVPGTYHIHPALYVGGVGPLIGPGQWVTVEPSPGGFQLPVSLLDGTVIADLQTYQTPFLLLFTTLTMLLGMTWMLYWTVPKPTVTRLAITNLIPSADIGSDFGLITGADIRRVTLIAAGAVLLLAAGVVYGKLSFPVTLPPQVIRVEAQPRPEPLAIAEVTPRQSSYDAGGHTLTLRMAVRNVGPAPVAVQQLTLANHEFVSGPLQQPWQSPMRVEPNTPLAPGETREVTLRIASERLEAERLVPVGEPVQAVTGVVVLSDASGTRNFREVRWLLSPTGL